MATIDTATVPPETRAASRDVRLRAMVDSHFDAVWRALKRLGVPESGVDDGAQQVFLVASRRLEEIEPSGERSYLLGVALRVAADARRTLRRRREVQLDDGREDLPHAALPPENLLDEKRARLALGAYLAS